MLEFLITSWADRSQSNDELTISLRDYCKRRCTALWMILLQQGKNVEPLSIAERGRGQALMNLMNSQYGLQSAHSGSGEQTETSADILRYVTSHTVFVAIGGNTINFWVLQKGQEPLFVQKSIDSEHANATASLVSMNKDAHFEICV